MLIVLEVCLTAQSRALSIVLFLLMVCVVAFLFSEKEVLAPLAPSVEKPFKLERMELAGSSQLDQPIEVTEEVNRFIKEVFIPDLRRLAQEYPIESVRVEMASTYEAVQDGRVKLTLAPGQNFRSALFFAIHTPEQRALCFSYPRVRALYGSSSRETRDDVLVGAFTHEGFHLLVQDPIPNTPEAGVRAESEAWHYTVKEIYLPMREEGRLQGLPASNAAMIAIEAYQRANGNPFHPAWVEWSHHAAGVAE